MRAVRSQSVSCESLSVILATEGQESVQHHTRPDVAAAIAAKDHADTSQALAVVPPVDVAAACWTLRLGTKSGAEHREEAFPQRVARNQVRGANLGATERDPAQNNDENSFPISPDEAQDPDGARGGRAHGPDPPPDAPGFQIRERDPHARRSQASRLYMRSRRAKPGPGHAGHPTMDLYLRTLLVCGQSAPTRVGAARHRRAAETPQPPGGTRRRRTT